MEEYNPFGKQTPESAAADYTEQANEAQTYAAEQAPKNPEGIYTGQAQFPQFGDTGKPNAEQASSSSLGDLQERIEAAKSNGWGAQAGNFLEKNRKRIVLLIIAALLFGGGFYAYNKNSQDIPALNLASISEDTDSNESNTENNTEDSGFSAQELGLQLNEGGELGIGGSGDGIPEFIRGDGSVITKTATAGDGITHLARYAIKDYLEEIGESLTAEQKIYAEDYVQNKIGSEFLEIGQKLSFSKELLSEGIEKAESLEEWQLENLEQYAANVSLL